MKKVIVSFLFLLVFGLQAAAQTVSIERFVLGSGAGTGGF